jgi:hypothetical protein
MPYVAMGSTKFNDVFNRIYEIMWDHGNWYVSTNDENVPTENINMFSADLSLFFESDFYHIQTLREMESDFGVLPFPKYNEQQENYRTNVIFFDTTSVPITVTDTDRSSIVIEALTAESARSVIPAYYEVSLKTKYSRDNESQEMLDLIFNTRVVDLGNTIWVDVIRDAVLAGMYKKNDRDLASKIASMETKVNAELAKIPAAQ